MISIRNQPGVCLSQVKPLLEMFGGVHSIRLGLLSMIPNDSLSWNYAGVCLVSFFVVGCASLALVPIDEEKK